MKLTNIEMADTPTKEELVKQIQANSDLFCKFISDIINNKDAWSIDNPKSFIEGLIAQSAIQTQNLFNSFIVLNNSKELKETEINTDNWLNCIMESSIAHLILAFCLIELKQDKSKEAFYTLVYEFLNLASMGTKPILH